MKKPFVQTLLAISMMSSLGLMAAGCSTTETTSAAATVPAVKTMKISSTVGNVMASGKILPDQEVQIVSKISGKVASVAVKEGSQVKQGDTVVKLETDDYALQVLQAQSSIDASQAKLADVKAGARDQEIEALQAAVQAAEAATEQTQAAIDQAKAVLDLSQKSYERTQNLFSQGAVAQVQMDQASTDLEKARTAYEQALAQQKLMEGQLSAAQAKLDLARSGPTSNTVKALQADVDRAESSFAISKNALNNTNITSPIHGTVVQRAIEPGEMAQPGVPLLTVVKMDQVQIQVSVGQEVVNQIQLGASVDIHVVGQDEKMFKGTVEFVSPVSDVNNSTFPVKIKVENQSGLLRAGMVAEVRFNEKARTQIEVPKTALVIEDDKFFVYKLNNDVVKLVEVQTKEKNQDWVFVTNGLASGDEIVINPTPQLNDGLKVKIN